MTTLICPSCQSAATGGIDLTPNQIHICTIPCPSRGAFARSSRTLGAGCGGRGRCQRRLTLIRGRQSRVVLTPRRWRQVCGGNFAGDGGKKARSPGRVRSKLLKPLRGECRVFPV